MSYLKSLPKETADITVTQYGNKRVYSDEARAKISKANSKLFEGKSRTEWAKIKGVSLARICTLLDQYGTVHVSDRRKLALNGKTKIIEGKTIKQWAQLLGESTATIHYRVKTYGTPHKPEKKLGKSHGNTKILYRNKSATEWAGHYNVDYCTICNHLKAHGNLTQLRKSLKSK